ncbi:MAG: 30S ribosome-binding factor RbfA [Burkholderiales bacterium]|nr:30S ribosome-binding factor RbfA [Burkholderiales bacterium]
MPRDYPRSRRIAEQVQRELTEIIRLELKDPRVGMITVTGVEVTSDNKLATVYFTRLGGDAAVAEAARGLQRAAGFLRSQLAGRFAMRGVPQLRFAYDASVERGARLSRLIEDAVAEDAARTALARAARRRRK